MTVPLPEPDSSSYTPIGIEAFRAAVSLVEELIEKIRDELTKLINNVNALIQAVADQLNDSIVGRVLEFVTGDVEDQLNQVRDLTATARDKISEILTLSSESVVGAVPVASLFSVGFELGDQVTRPLTSMYGDMMGSGDIDFWRGPAKNTYEKRVQSQQDAVTSSAAKVKKLAEYLGSAAAGNMTYMSSLGERLAAILASLVSATVDLAAVAAGAVTQAVALLAHFSEVIGTAAGEIVGYTTTLSARISEVLSQILSLEAEKADLTGLTANGMWPSPVAE